MFRNSPEDAKWDYAFACQKLYILSNTLGLIELKNVRPSTNFGKAVTKLASFLDLRRWALYM